MSNLLVGIGSAGISLVADIQAKLGYAALAVSTDQARLNDSTIEQRLLLGPDCCQGYSAIDAAQAREAALESAEQIRQAMSGHQQVVLVAALGGGTASGAIAVLADQALALGQQVIIVAALPFSFEQQQHNSALQLLEQLQQQYRVLVVDNEHEQTAGDIYAGQSLRAAELIRQQLQG